MDEKFPSAREHADKMLKNMVDSGKIKADPNATTDAVGMPLFSKGTATLDPNTGQPVAPADQAETPAFTDGGVALPEATTSAAPVSGEPSATAPVRTAQDVVREHAARLEGTAAAPEAAPTAQQEAGAAAAEAAAEAVADAFAEYEEFEIEDPDLDLKYPIRVPKKYATSAKRGYPRRAEFDRSVRYLKGAEPVIAQLIQDGRINQILPLLQRALQDPAYGEYVYQGYDRLQKGLPLIEQARQEAAQSAQVAPQVPQFDLLEQEDPFFAERVKPIVTPILSQVQSLQQKIEAQERAQQTAQERQLAIARQNEQRALEMQAAHQDIARAYPGQTRVDLGPNDPFWQKAIQQAKDAGYVDTYGVRAGIMFGAQLAAQVEAERLATTGSPTAEFLQQAETKHLDLARREAANASRAVGGGNATPAPAPAPRPKPSTRNADGTLKGSEQFLRETQQYIMSNGRA